MVELMELTKKQVKRVKAILPDIEGGIRVELPFEWSSAWAEAKRKESPSSIVSFLGCPLKWYIERYSPLPGSDDVSVFSLAGTIAHRILEVFYSEPPLRRTDRLLKEILAVTWDAIKEGNDEDGIIDLEIINGYTTVLEQGTYSSDRQESFLRSIVNKAVNNVFEFDEFPKEIEVIANEKWLRMVVNGVRINGKGDRIRRLPNGRYSIDDWKTGKVYNDDDDEITVLDTTFLPAGLYALMLLEMTKDELIPPDIESVSLLYLVHAKEFKVDITQEALATVYEVVDRTTKMMNQFVVDGALIATPTARKSDTMCKYCPIIDYCPAWTDNVGLEGVREAWGV